jgi:hypothetical protein
MTTINSAAALYALMTTTNSTELGLSYIQTADIDMSAYPTASRSIASGQYAFTGSYDGQGYTITLGDVYNASDNYYTGLFDLVTLANLSTPVPIIKNINLIYKNNINITVNGVIYNEVWGGLVGSLVVGNILNCSITINGTMTIGASANGIPIGILSGFVSQNSSIINTRVIINNTVSLSGLDNANLGLLCGQATDSQLTNCSVTSSSGTYNISLSVTDNSSVPGDYSSIGLLCGYFGTNFLSLNQPLLINNTVNLNNTGNVTLNNSGTGTTYIGAICGTLDGDSTAGSTDATNCSTNINNNQITRANLSDFGQLVDNVTIQNCLYTYTTTTANSQLTIDPIPSPTVPVILVNTISNTYNLNSGNYYIPGTNASLVIGSEILTLQSQTSPGGIIINGTLYRVGNSYSSSNSAYTYTINIKGVGSMYFGLSLTSIINANECICQTGIYSTNPQTGISASSRITNIVEDKTIHINIDRELAIPSINAPKIKSYSDYIKYLQGALRY